MSDWEDMVNKVCVAGRPGFIDAFDQEWGTIFQNARTVAESLRDGIKDLKQSWQGQAADDYFAKLEKIAKTIDDVESNNSDVRPMLQTAKDALQYAQTNMPVPDYMLDNVQGRQDALNRANGIYGTGAQIYAGIESFGVSYLAFKLTPGSFQEGFMSGLGNVTREVFGHVTAWIDDKTDEAKSYYDSMDNTYAQASVAAADPKQALTGVGQGPYSPYPTNQNFGAGANPGVSGLGTDGYKPSAYDPSAASSGVDGYNPGGTGTTGYDPNEGSLSSLAGAGPGGLSGLDGGGSGLGGLGGGVGGLGGGLGSPGLGAAGAGRAVGGPSLPMGLGGMGGAAGRGVGAQGRGMMGGAGHGAGGHAPEDEHGTWLTEDEDPWGGDSDAPPSLLG